MKEVSLLKILEKKMNTDIKNFIKGIVKENPTFVIMLGMCPTLAVTTQFINALSMGIGVIFVLLLSNIIISILKNLIPNSIRIPCYIVIISAFISVVSFSNKSETSASVSSK